jgi:hypothetical protein
MKKADPFRTVMEDSYQKHPSDEALERFLLNQSQDEELDVIETHILACEACVTQLEALELQIAAAKIALREMESIPAKQRSATAGWRSWFTVPALSWAGAAAAAAGAIMFFSIPRETTVSAYRGTETAVVSEWRPLRLQLNTTDLEPGPVTVELVNANGLPVWKGSSVAKNDKVAVSLPRLTHSGKHFLRLYSPGQNGAQGELLREYALEVKWQF